MTDVAPEFSRLVSLARLGPEPFRQEIAATAAEREALVRRLDLVALDRLTAVVELNRQRRDTILLRASFAAEFVQSCVVTLEPVPGVLGGDFSLRYGPPEAEHDPSLRTGVDPDGEEETFEPLRGGAIDIGEAVAQEFSLALPAFPRDPEAIVEVEAGAGAGTDAFAALASRHSEDGP